MRGFKCPSCNGDQCEACHYTGFLTIAECPRQLVTPDIWEAVRLSQYAAKGSWPIDGGTLCQSVQFCEAHDLAQSVFDRLAPTPDGR